MQDENGSLWVGYDNFGQFFLDLFAITLWELSPHVTTVLRHTFPHLHRGELTHLGIEWVSGSKLIEGGELAYSLACGTGHDGGEGHDT